MFRDEGVAGSNPATATSFLIQLNSMRGMLWGTKAVRPCLLRQWCTPQTIAWLDYRALAETQRLCEAATYFVPAPL